MKSGEEPDVWRCCLDALLPRLRVTPKRTSTLSRSKTVENRVSRYLWGNLRDWEALHDISGNGWVGEVKAYSWETIGAKGGVLSVLRDALKQCQSVCKEASPFACLVAKGTRAFEQSLVLTADGRLWTLEQFREVAGRS
jgi:hypothetical protein